MQPKVSVVVPVYNVEQYLVECMESITHQTLEDIEVIVINDGSTDNSNEIITTPNPSVASRQLCCADALSVSLR